MRGQIDLAVFGAFEDGSVLAGEFDVHIFAEENDAGKKVQPL